MPVTGANETMSDVMFVDDAEYAETEPVRRDISIITSIAARYILTRYFDAKGNRREFSGRVMKISAESLTMSGPVKGLAGESVIAKLPEFGDCNGTVTDSLDIGFVMSIDMPDAERDRFASKIAWYEKYRNYDVPDNRKYRRIIPKNPHSIVMLGDGTIVRAFVIDISVSGVAVSADIDVNMGEPLAVGRIVGRVVRMFDGGFAVKFITLQNPLTLERLLSLPRAAGMTDRSGESRQAG